MRVMRENGVQELGVMRVVRVIKRYELLRVMRRIESNRESFE